jgi:hypothetical protein
LSQRLPAGSTGLAAISSLKKYPLIAAGTPDPYMPPN